MTLVFIGMWAFLFILVVSRVILPRRARLREHPRLKVFVDATWVLSALLLTAGIMVSLIDRSGALNPLIQLVTALTGAETVAGTLLSPPEVRLIGPGNSSDRA